MTAAITLPGDTFVAWLLLATAAFIALVCWARDADHRLQQIIDGLLELEAADHGEPSRAQVEAEWTQPRTWQRARRWRCRSASRRPSSTTSGRRCSERLGRRRESEVGD